MIEKRIEFNRTDWYPPMIVVQEQQYSWTGHERWEVVLPLKSYGMAQKVRLGYRSHKNDYNGELIYSIKRALRAKQMVVAYKDIPVYIQIPPKTNEYIELTEETAVEYILLYGG